jgi:hypothetical protein
METNRSPFGTKLMTILIILVILTALLFVKGYISGFNTASGETSSKAVQDFNSIANVQNRYNLILPDFVTSYTNENDDLNIEVTMNQIIEIYTDEFVVKVMPFVNNNADPLGLYESDSNTVDLMYLVKSDSNENSINFVRYRTGIPSYEHCTAINYCTESMAYGILIGNIISEQEVFDLINIDKDNLEQTDKISNDGIVESETDTDTENSIIKVNNTEISLPVTKSKIERVDLDGVTSLFIDDTMIISIVYNDYDIKNNTYGGQSEITIDTNMKIYYMSDNPFEIGTYAYNDYNNIKEYLDSFN